MNIGRSATECLFSRGDVGGGRQYFKSATRHVHRSHAGGDWECDRQYSSAIRVGVHSWFRDGSCADTEPPGLANQTSAVRGIHTKHHPRTESQISALQQVEKAPGAVPPSPVAPQTSDVPVVHVPVEYYGTETRTRQTEGEDEDGAPRIDNEALDAKLRGFFHLPDTRSSTSPRSWFEKLGWKQSRDWGDPPTFGGVCAGQCETLGGT